MIRGSNFAHFEESIFAHRLFSRPDGLKFASLKCLFCILIAAPISFEYILVGHVSEKLAMAQTS
jgi:hypothetical protein